MIKVIQIRPNAITGQPLNDPGPGGNLAEQAINETKKSSSRKLLFAIFAAADAVSNRSSYK
jgi:hypothetical protein